MLKNFFDFTSVVLCALLDAVLNDGETVALGCKGISLFLLLHLLVFNRSKWRLCFELQLLHKPAYILTKHRSFLVKLYSLVGL